MGEYITKEMLGEGVGFCRTRRITGYLNEDVSNWNNAKKAEEKDRVKHLNSSDKNTLVA